MAQSQSQSQSPVRKQSQFEEQSQVDRESQVERHSPDSGKAQVGSGAEGLHLAGSRGYIVT